MHIRPVVELVAESPSLGHLAKFVEPGSPQPSRVNARKVWNYLCERILPSLVSEVALDAKRYPQPLRDFKGVERLAQSVGIEDFSLRDFMDPTLDRWHAQMAQVDAFIRFHNSTLSDLVQPVLIDVNESRRQLEVENSNLEDIGRRLKAVQESRAEHTGNMRSEVGRQLSGLEAEVREKQRKLDILQTQYEEESNREKELLRVRDHLEQKYNEFVEHTDLLKPVIARGVGLLKPEVTRLDQEVDQLEAEKQEIEKTAQQYAMTLQVFSQLKPELEELSRQKAVVQELQTRRQVFETENVVKSRQRKEQLSKELAACTRQDQRLRIQLAELERELVQYRDQIAEMRAIGDIGDGFDPLNGTGAGTGERSGEDVDENSEEILKSTQARVSELTESNHKLRLTVHSERNWLKGMVAVEKEGQKLAGEVEVVKQWMKLYLRELADK